MQMNEGKTKTAAAPPQVIINEPNEDASMNTNSNSNSNNNTELSLNGLILKILLEILLISPIFLAGPFYWYLIQGPAYREDWYSVFDITSKTVVWQVECTRWLLWSYHLVLQYLLTMKLPRIVKGVISGIFSEMLLICHDSNSRVEVLTATSKYIFNFISSISLFFTTQALFAHPDTDRHSWQYFLERTVLLYVISSAVVMIEKGLLHLIEIEFQRSLYQDRVYKCMYNIWILKTIKMYTDSKMSATAKNSKNTKNPNANMSSNNVNSSVFIWEKKSCPIQPTASNLLSTFLMEEETDKSVVNEIKGNRFKIIKDFHKLLNFNHGHDHDDVVNLKDIQYIFTEEEAKRVMLTLTSTSSNPNANISTNTNNTNTNITADDTNSEIRKDQFIGVFNQVFKDRGELVKILKTHVTIIAKLDKVLLCFFAGLIVYFSPIFGLDLGPGSVLNFGVTLGPLIISFNELFGGSLKMLSEAIFFILICHPYDIGDRVSIDGIDFFVHKMGLVSTTFRRFDGFIVSFPNYLLAKKALGNIRRTGFQSHRLEIHFSAGPETKMSALTTLQSEVKEFIQVDKFKYFDSIITSFFDLQPSYNRISLVFLLKHRFNFQDAVRRAERLNYFLKFLKDRCEKLGLDYSPPVFTALLECDHQFQGHYANTSINKTTTTEADMVNL